MAKIPSTRRVRVHQFKEAARMDPYRSQLKPRGMPFCPKCKAVSVRGRWLSRAQFASRSTKSAKNQDITSKLKCPACKQLDEHFAEGTVELHGERWKDKRDLVLNTIRRTEEIARVRNDQQRILWMNEEEGVQVIYVSLPELARHIGRELERSFQGQIQLKPSYGDTYLRVCWQSDLPHLKSKARSRSRAASKSKAGSTLRATARATAGGRSKLQQKSRAFRGRGV